MDIITLNTNERQILFRQDPATEGSGGFQNLLIKLQNQFDAKTNTLKIYSRDLEKIGRYAFKYGNGGWERRLVRIFGRHYGPYLKYY